MPVTADDVIKTTIDSTGLGCAALNRSQLSDDEPSIHVRFQHVLLAIMEKRQTRRRSRRWWQCRWCRRCARRRSACNSHGSIENRYVVSCEELERRMIALKTARWRVHRSIPRLISARPRSAPRRRATVRPVRPASDRVARSRWTIMISLSCLPF